MKSNPTDFIEVYETAFNDEFCKKAIAIFEQAEDMGLTISRSIENDSPMTKSDKSFFLNSESVTEYDFYHSQYLAKVFNDVFWNIGYKDYKNKYAILSELAPHGNWQFKIQKTKPTEGYHIWHCEQMNRITSTRVLAWTVYLNDDFEGGETEFLYQQKRIAPVTGSMCIFPAGFTHTHRGNPPLGGVKYIMTGWLEY